MYTIKKLNSISRAVHEYLPDDKYNFIEEGNEYDACIVRSADCHSIDFPKELLAVARAGAGVNNIPIDKCSEEGIVVFNTPGANANGVKELVLAGMLIATRNLIPAVDWVRQIEGDDVLAQAEKGKKNFVGNELKNKTLGVIGLGAIGVLVANSACAIGMKVIGYDPYISIENAWGLRTSVDRAMSLDTLLENSDYISVHVPLVDKTRNLISAPEFAKMKKGAIILNFARNGLVNVDDLCEALDGGIVSKYVTDFPNRQLLDHKNVIAFPHLGASTPESEENCAQMAAKQLRDYIENGSIVNSVNMPECIVAPSDKFRITIIHQNLPNMVGQMTAIFANFNLNISDMVNKSRDKIAYTVFNLDTELPDSAKAELNGIEGVIKVRIFSK